MQNKRRPWYLGNTTVRNPYRLKDGLMALVGSFLHGNLDGKQNEQQFAQLLHESGVVAVKRIEDGSNSDSSDVGRKWRAALSQLGFIIHKDASLVDPSLGRANIVTPNGKRLLSATSVVGIQECFLRSLLAYQIPSPIENHYEYNQFSPLVHILKIMNALETSTGFSAISKSEIGFFVQLSSSDDNLEEIVDCILKYREERALSPNKKRFDTEIYKRIASENTNVQYETLKDYADSNLRYLKVTGLFSSNGRGIRFQDEKIKTIGYIIENHKPILDNKQYLHALFEGADLPTDNLDNALSIVQELNEKLIEKGYNESFDVNNRDIKDINSLRYNLEEQLLGIREEEFAKNQVDLWKDIVAYMDAIAEKKKIFELPSTGEDVSMNTEELPAYFEWTLWRAFLAINHLKIHPSNARRFSIDGDILPISHAPGGGADCIFVFDDFVIILEVTLTESSRQEAAEGEPVRRHVAKYVEYYEEQGKRVYGLFIANKIDSNTAETFRYGVRYNKDDDKVPLNIVPFTLRTFRDFFEGLFLVKMNHPNHLVSLMDTCILDRNKYDAPGWKNSIINSTEAYLKSL